MVGIDIESPHGLACRTRHFDKVLAPPHLGADFFQLKCKGRVALNRIFAHAVYPHRFAAEQAGGQEVGCARSVSFHLHHLRRAVAGGGRQPETAVIFVCHLHAEFGHQIQRDVDIGAGNQHALHFNLKRLAGQRQRHQKRSQKLAGDAAFDFQAAFALILPLANQERRIAFLALIVDLRTGRAQGIDQIADRPLVHPLHPVQAVAAAQQRQNGG